MAKSKFRGSFKIERDPERCINCQACVRMCSNDAHVYDEENNIVSSILQKQPIVNNDFPERSSSPKGCIRILGLLKM